MFIRNILKEYSNLFFTILKVLLLLALCTILGALVVYPLYRFATDYPSAYSYTILGIIVICTVIYLAVSIRKAGFLSSAKLFCQLVIIFGGLYACYQAVMEGSSFYAIPVLVLCIVLYGLTLLIHKKNN